MEKLQEREAWNKEDLESIEKRVEALALNEEQLARAKRQLNQFQKDGFPAAGARSYIMLFDRYYRHGRNPPGLPKTEPAPKIYESERIKERFQIYEALEIGDYKGREDLPEFQKAKKAVQVFLSSPVFLREGVGFMFLGDVGTGKTALARTLAKKIGDACFVSCPEIFNLLRSSEENAQIRECLTTAPLLVLDDLSQEYRSDFSEAELDNLISRRDRGNLSTVITSNLFLEELKDPKTGYSPRILDRLESRSLNIFEFHGESYRRGPKGAPF